jgi:hypothetical protein
MTSIASSSSSPAALLLAELYVLAPRLLAGLLLELRALAR